MDEKIPEQKPFGRVVPIVQPEKTLRKLAASIKIDREVEYSGNTWDDWEYVTFIDMVLSKMERAWRHARGGSPTVDVAESLRDGYNYLLELKSRLLKERSLKYTSQEISQRTL